MQLTQTAVVELKVHVEQFPVALMHGTQLLIFLAYVLLHVKHPQELVLETASVLFESITTHPGKGETMQPAQSILMLQQIMSDTIKMI